MPIYLFANPKDENEIIEVVMSVHDKHEYERDGILWNRIFTIPTTSIDTKWDCNNPKDFVEKTKNKKGTIGDLWDKSAELSEKRQKQQGVDKVKQNYYKEYNKATKKLHPQQRKEKIKELTSKPVELKIKK